MALIPYKNPGDKLDAAGMNVIISAADSILTNYLGGLSPFFLYYGSSFAGLTYGGFPRKFFFGVTPPAWPAGVHPLAYFNLGPSAPMISSTRSGFLAAYDHNSFLTAIAALTVDSGSPNAISADFGVTRLNAGSSWTKVLDACLSILRYNGNAVVLRRSNGAFISGLANGFNQSGEVEIIHGYDAIDVIVLADLTWDSTWDKYNVFRFHNLGTAPTTITFDHASVQIPAGCCKCVRRDKPGGTYTIGNNYLHKLLSGDPRFAALNDTASCCLFSPFNIIDIFQPMDAFEKCLDASRFWDMSALYCDANPANKYFPVPSAGVTIFDLVAHRGLFTATTVKTGVGSQVNQLRFTGLADLVNLLAPFATFSINSQKTVATIALTNGFASVFFADIGTNLFFRLGGNHTPGIVGSANFNLSQFLFTRLTRLLVKNNATVENYSTWSFDGTNYTTTGTVSQTLNQSQWALDPSDTLSNSLSFSIADTWQKIVDFLNQSNCSLISISDIEFQMTPFGPSITWNQNYNLSAGFVNQFFGRAGFFDRQSNIVSYSYAAGKVTLKMSYSLAGSTTDFPINYQSIAPIHYPRQPRAYSASRAVIHDGTKEPWQLTNGPYTSLEPPNVKRFFESKPVGTEAPETDAAALLPRPDGANYLGTLDGNTVPVNNVEQALGQVEHYNALASQINGMIPPKSKIWAKAQNLGVDFFGNVFGVPQYPPGGVPGPNLSLNGGPFFARDCFYDWTAPTSGPDKIADYLASFGATIKTGSDLPDGYASTDYSDRDSNFAANIARYRWITITDAKKVYDALNIPFKLSHVCAPMAFGQSGYFSFGDPAFFTADGNWLHFIATLNSFHDTASDQNFHLLNRTIGSLIPAQDPDNPDIFLPAASSARLYQVISILAFNTDDILVIMIPENYFNLDPDYAAANLAAYQNLGMGIIPIIVNNAVENNPPENTVVPGTSASGIASYETVLTTALDNAKVEAFFVG